VASLVGGVENLVVEDGEVQGETKADGMCRGEVSLSNVGCGSVSLERLVGRSLALVAKGELSEVAVIVTLPVMILSPARACRSLTVVLTSCGRTPLTRHSEQRE